MLFRGGELFQTEQMNSKTIWEALSLGTFYVLFITSSLYQLQHYVPAVFSAESRFLLYVVIGFCLILSNRKIWRVSFLFFALAILLALVGLHSWLLHGGEFAARATARFGNVLFIAPLAALLFPNEKYLQVFFTLLVVIFAIVLASLIYQHLGGDMETMVRGYVAIRGDLRRHMTIAGEPNVGGMLAVLVFVVAMLGLHSLPISVGIGGAAVFFIFCSLSKAALVGFPLVIGMMLLLLVGSGEKQVAKALLGKCFMACAAGLLMLFLLDAQDYFFAAVQAVLGNLTGEPSVLEDLAYRQGGLEHLTSGSSGEDELEEEEGSSSLFDRSLFPFPLNYLFGASFGVVGSVAYERLGPMAAILPHNSYVEMFLAGGAVLTLVVLALMGLALRSLFVSAFKHQSKIELCAFVCLAILACWMFVYPIIYEPVTGSVFWALIGYGNRLRSDEKQGFFRGAFKWRLK